MRGKRHPHICMDSDGRITPAHAGKTSGSTPPRRPSTDHPRACGENQENLAPCKTCSGSPPRMRGKLIYKVSERVPARITPAHAGKTLSHVVPALHMTDHPRACGENYKRYGAKVATDGSPPRMRGKPKSHGCVRKHRRITPAHAGKTSGMSCCALRHADHPRACGENSHCLSA